MLERVDRLRIDGYQSAMATGSWREKKKWLDTQFLLLDFSVHCLAHWPSILLNNAHVKPNHKQHSISMNMLKKRHANVFEKLNMFMSYVFSISLSLSECVYVCDNNYSVLAKLASLKTSQFFFNRKSCIYWCVPIIQALEIPNMFLGWKSVSLFIWIANNTTQKCAIHWCTVEICLFCWSLRLITIVLNDTNFGNEPLADNKCFPSKINRPFSWLALIIYHPKILMWKWNQFYLLGTQHLLGNNRTFLP